MPRVARNLVSRDAIAAAFAKAGQADRPVVSPKELAEILGLKEKTIYCWIGKGHLDGSFRTRGKHHLIWRDKAIDILFNGPEWEHTSKWTKTTETPSETECGSTRAESSESTVPTSGMKANTAACP
jgi:hypothetical protein